MDNYFHINQEDFISLALKQIDKLIDTNIYHAYTVNEVEFFIFGMVSVYCEFCGLTLHEDLSGEILQRAKERHSLVEEQY